MSRWFRFYDDVINDPKVMRLSEAMRWHWVAVLCASSKNDGVCPPLSDLSFMLRIPEQKLAAILAELSSASLLDKTGDGFTPHNWNGRQYKSDVSTERVKRFRNAKRNGDETLQQRPQIQSRTETEDRIGDARAKPSIFTEGSKALTDAFWQAMGISDPLHVPLELAGTDYRAVGWETAGWSADMIAAEVKRVGPGKPLTYYEKVFATAHAKRQAPLPVVDIREAEKLTVTTNAAPKHRSGGSLLAAIDREIAKAEREANSDLEVPAYSVLSLADRSVR